MAIRRLAVLLILGYGLIGTVPAHAFRCGHEVVDRGDHKYDVLSKCGEPDFRDSYATAYLPGVGPVDVIEQWYYNPGPSGLVRILTFQQGRLRSITTDGYGFDKHGRDRRCEPGDLRIGMSTFELLSRCGEPAARDQWLEISGGLPHYGYLTGSVVVEEWTYTFGPTRFRRFVRIVRGRVVNIEHGDWGG